MQIDWEKSRMKRSRTTNCATNNCPSRLEQARYDHFFDVAAKNRLATKRLDVTRFLSGIRDGVLLQVCVTKPGFKQENKSKKVQLNILINNLIMILPAWEEKTTPCPWIYPEYLDPGTLLQSHNCQNTRNYHWDTLYQESVSMWRSRFWTAIASLRPYIYLAPFHFHFTYTYAHIFTMRIAPNARFYAYILELRDSNLTM